ncbi:hypothetical protein NC653_025524 [Populus alba x Populus x berolinensis]|uniref:Uncharacterized protein n=1 Tax=Populus alba x Populus x berolinensis TaxID=444605 RepID=A0AAD6MCB2_9ROSI|nr:hypothetical protein NC653_025524 [Populus alba x Populus x berolinensis]
MALSLPSLEPQQQQQRTTTNREIQEIDIFHQFDVVSDSSDHHYLHIKNSSSKKTKGEGDSFTNISSGASKKIMQEWKILEKHLPDSIYVRVYENRIDLLRAVIIGAAEKFKGLMGQLYPQLVSAFKINGASLGDFLEQLKQPVEKKTLSFNRKTVRMFFGKLKKVLGLKKENSSGESGVKGKGS